MKKYFVGIAVCFLLLGNVQVAEALQVGISINDGAYGNGNSINTGSDWSLGWSFSTYNDILITDLGFYDYANSVQDGLAYDHQIGLWTGDGTLLTSAVVNSGTSDPLIDSFRYASISPVLLEAGETFMIAATNPMGVNDGVITSETVPAAAGFSPGI